MVHSLILKYIINNKPYIKQNVQKQFCSDVDVISHMLVGSTGEIQSILSIKQLVKQPGSRAFDSNWVFDGAMCEKYRNTVSDVKIYEEVDFLCLVPGVWMCAVDVANNFPDWVCVSPVCWDNAQSQWP